MCETWGQVTDEGTKHLATRPPEVDGLAACYTNSIALWQGPDEDADKKLL